jgi:hypothetical protein
VLTADLLVYTIYFPRPHFPKKTAVPPEGWSKRFAKRRFKLDSGTDLTVITVYHQIEGEKDRKIHIAPARSSRAQDLVLAESKGPRAMNLENNKTEEKNLCMCLNM